MPHRDMVSIGELFASIKDKRARPQVLSKPLSKVLSVPGSQCSPAFLADQITLAGEQSSGQISILTVAARCCERDRSAVGLRHHLHPLADRVRLSGRDPGRLLTLSGGLHAGQPLGDCGAGTDDCSSSAIARPSTSLRPRRAVRLSGLRSHPEAAWDRGEHEPAGESLRQRELRELLHDPETGRATLWPMRPALTEGPS